MEGDGDADGGLPRVFFKPAGLAPTSHNPADAAGCWPESGRPPRLAAAPPTPATMAAAGRGSPGWCFLRC